MSDMKLNGNITLGSWEIKDDDGKYIINRDGEFHGIFRTLESAIEELHDQQSDDSESDDLSRNQGNIHYIGGTPTISREKTNKETP